MPTQERLRELFYIDPIISKLMVNACRSCGSENVPAHTYVNNTGYPMVHVDGRKYLVHRVVWILLNGEIPPKMQIDHINGNQLDYSPDNLRLATHSLNQKNTKLRVDNKSGVPGIDFRRGRWQVRLQSNRTRIFVGEFETLADAIAARKNADSEHGFHVNHGRRRAA